MTRPLTTGGATSRGGACSRSVTPRAGEKHFLHFLHFLRAVRVAACLGSCLTSRLILQCTGIASCAGDGASTLAWRLCASMCALQACAQQFPASASRPARLASQAATISVPHQGDERLGDCCAPPFPPLPLQNLCPLPVLCARG